MKKNHFVVLFLLLAFVIVSGCSDSITNPPVTTNKYKARTEAELNSSSASKVIPGAVVYLALEHLNTPIGSVSDDSGPIGEDIIPYTYTETASHRFKLDASARFKVRLVSEAGVEIFRIDNPTDTEYVSIPAGNYKLHLTSIVEYGPGETGTQAIFIQPDLDAINSGAGAPPQGGYDRKDLNTLLTTNKCIKCDLQEIQLNDKNLAGADVSGANMDGSFLVDVNFNNGIFTNTSIRHAGGRNMKFVEAKFTNTDLRYTGYQTSDLSRATFKQLLWQHTNLDGCNLTGITVDSGSTYDSSVDGADLSHSTFSNVTLHELSGAEAKFIKATFSNVYCYEAYFRSSVADSASFINNCNFMMSNFTGGKARYTTFTDFRGDATLWDNNDMTGSNVTRANFNGGFMIGTILTNAVWLNVDVLGTHMCDQIRNGWSRTNVRTNDETTCRP